MREGIVRLETWLQAHRPDYLAALAAGATDEEFAAFERTVGRQLPSELAALYRWHNGQADSCYAALHDNWMFSSLASIAEAWEMTTELLEGGDFERANWWQPGWIPFLDNGGGDHLCVDLDGTFTGQAGQVLEFWHDDADRVVVYPNVATYFEVVVRSLEETAWGADEEYWEIDPKIAATLAPGYPKRFKAGA
jgi:cell wall assembly regulator SMI1